MSANCEYYESLMSRMLDSDLLPQETELLREHIRTCKSCRTLCAAFSGMTLSLRDDLVEPPMGLADAVMSRIRTEEAEKAPETDIPEKEPVPLPRTRTTPAKMRWMPTVFAACLVLVIGVGAVASMGRGKSADTAESAAYSRLTEAQNAAPAAAEPAPMMEESAVFDMAVAEESAMEEDTAPMEPAAPAPEAAEAETAGGTVQGYTVNDPAFVPEGSEAAFEALLTDAGYMPEGTLRVFYYVEHRGVIYEFMTDESEEYLLWRDAAEGFPLLSQSSAHDLWAIFK